VADNNSKSSLANGQGHHHLLEKQPSSFVTVSDTNWARGFRAFRGAKLKALTVYGELGFDLFHIAAISPWRGGEKNMILTFELPTNIID
jgi:hypothetical protein